MSFAHEHLRGLSGGKLAAFLVKSVLPRDASQVANHAPHAVQELVHARKAVLVPLQLLVGGAMNRMYARTASAP